jgi:hypothetical protein
MRKARLEPDAAAYLLAADYLPVAFRHIISEQLDIPLEVGLSMSVDDATAESLREVFTKRLAEVGFDAAYTLTPEGLLLEDLIDKFSG